MKITFELEPADIARFRRALERAHDAVKSADEGDILDSAKHTLDSLPLGNAPVYIRDRIRQVQRLIAMLEDEAWALPPRFRLEVVKVLVYFSDPDDLIPDSLPVIGMLDDAIMLELLLRDEQDLLRAYDRFCNARRALGPVPHALEARTTWTRNLAARRSQLLTRLMKSRDNRDKDDVSA